jgi:hypothetical protein
VAVKHLLSSQLSVPRAFRFGIIVVNVSAEHFGRFKGFNGFQVRHTRMFRCDMRFWTRSREGILDLVSVIIVFSGEATHIYISL